MPENLSQLEQLIQTVRTLRSSCAWTKALTHESLRTYLIEESYEVLDAIAGADPELLKEELGDLYFQILLHALIAQEHGHFDLEDIAAGLNAKLRRRNRHVFDAQGRIREQVITDIDEIIRVWDAAKQAERVQQPQRKRAGLPAGLPSLSLAQKLLDRHARAGQDTAPISQLAESARERVEDEQSLATELLALSARAEELGLDAESVLRTAVSQRYSTETDATTSP